MTEDPEPKDKLDTITTGTTGGLTATGSSVGMVNGPEDDVLDWLAI